LLGPATRRLAPTARIADIAFLWVYLNGWIMGDDVNLTAEFPMSGYFEPLIRFTVADDRGMAK